MELGAFSVNLAVKDLAASEEFYSKLGFERMGGNPDFNYLILKNGDHVIGLFQDMFEGNILTFNPGWNQSAEQLESFEDVRALRQQFMKAGLELTQEANFENESGPASFALIDPDGNAILIDQHV